MHETTISRAGPAGRRGGGNHPLLPAPLACWTHPGAAAGIRRYGEQDARRLRFIRSAKAAGFTLEQIRELLDLDASEDRRRAHALATERIAALDEKIAELQAARQSLHQLAHACGSSSKGPCPILTAFEQPLRAC